MKKLLGLAVLSAVTIFGSTTANARSVYYSELVAQYGSNTGCYVCHTGEMGSLLPYGQCM